MGLDLLGLFAEVSDGRGGQGWVRPVAVVLALCAAVVAGMGSFTAIAGWVADVPAELLAQLYGRVAAPPSKATIWRVITGVDAVVVDAVIGAWLAGQVTARDAAAPGSEGDSLELVEIAVDGTTVRGAIDPEGNQVHLLAAATHRDALVLGQIEVDAKTNGDPDVRTFTRRARRGRARPDQHGDHRGRTPYPARPRRVPPRTRRGVRGHRQTKPARTVRRARRAALVTNPNRAP
jgi:DDE family transposase